MNTLIQPDDTWLLWGFLAGWAAVSIYLEQKYKWASRISGAIIALVGAMLLANFNIIPTESPVYDTVWGYVVPLAIPLLLFRSNIFKIWKESGRLLLIFLISSIGTVAGAIVGFFVLKQYIPSLDKITAMMTGSYIGGSVNFAAMATKFETPGELVSATVVADNLLMAIYFLVLILLPTLQFFRNKYRTPHIDEVERSNHSDKNLAASYWERKDMSLLDISKAVGTAFGIVAISFTIASYFDHLIPSGENVSIFFNVLNGILGDNYLMLTTLTMLLVTVFPRYFESINGAQEIGTYLIYIFFVVIGVPASLPLILQNAPLIFVFVTIMVLINMIVSFGVGKVTKFSLEEIILASNANIGGPTTAAAMAISKGWTKLVGPILLVGTLGYIIGNYAGTAIGLWLKNFL
ncbi:DUF819 domain-containing protein [Pallidibacillus thermolactis]|uniref:DUF819 family protein n=1 Tax=Pallidibacillus thermolactis TaxID=251051 RepID=UPI00156ABF6A|nr:DUF819 family protein [Pallidibacillus thermolactis]MED1672665.1 DUF819 family protein [Pallidibacillus thermolactis subsp. kokeshiiformis]